MNGVIIKLLNIIYKLLRSQIYMNPTQQSNFNRLQINTNLSAKKWQELQPDSTRSESQKFF